MGMNKTYYYHSITFNQFNKKFEIWLIISKIYYYMFFKQRGEVNIPLDIISFFYKTDFYATAVIISTY